MVLPKTHKGRLETTGCSLFGASHRILMCTKKEWATGALGLADWGKASSWVGEAEWVDVHMLCDSVFLQHLRKI